MKLLREPLVHFLALGALLFVLFEWMGPTAPSATATAVEDGSRRIAITPGLLENLRLSFQRQEGHAPDAKELDGAIDAYVREEILNREARALGLDRDDPSVRRWLVQRMEFLTDDNIDLPPPTDADLNAFLAAHPERFKRADGQPAALASVKPAVRQAWQEARRREARDDAYRALRERYTVVREPAPATSAASASPAPKNP